MLQGNRSEKQANAVVGLHYHLHQADYWYVTKGRARVVLHDLRKGSPTDGQTLIVEIGEHNDWGVFIPPGVAHGFSALTDMTLTYLVDQYYNPADERGVAWDDPAIGADWGVTDPVLSARVRVPTAMFSAAELAFAVEIRLTKLPPAPWSRTLLAAIALACRWAMAVSVWSDLTADRP